MNLLLLHIIKPQILENLVNPFRILNRKPSDLVPNISKSVDVLEIKIF